MQIIGAAHWAHVKHCIRANKRVPL